MDEERESPSAGRRFLQGGLPAVVTGRPTENRARKGALAGLVGAVGVGILEHFVGFIPALAIMIVAVALFVVLIAWSSSDASPSDS